MSTYLITNNLISAIHADDVKKFEYVLSGDKDLINSKNDIGWTILHYCCIWGSENIFKVIYPQLKKPRLNMFDKHNKTPFHKAIIGPSDYIFNTMLTDGRIEVTKCKSSAFSSSRNEAVFQLIMHPEFKQRVLTYFNHVNNLSTTWSHWFEQSMFEGQLWAVELVIDQNKYSEIQNYFRFYGMIHAIKGDKRNVIEYMVKYDGSILENHENGNALSEALRWPGRLEYLISLMDDRLKNPTTGMYYDILIMNMSRFDSAKDFFNMVNKKDILISEQLVINMLTQNIPKNKEFLESCYLRSDYYTFIFPIIIENDPNGIFLPEQVKDIFSF